MVKVDIVSGFLGAGKTTLIKKLLGGPLQGYKVALIENEFGEIGIDSGFLRESGVEIREMSSGCICCSLVGDFGEALKEVIRDYDCDRVVIEPSGVGKLSDVIAAVEKNTDKSGTKLASYSTVIDGNKCKMYMKNFGEFYNNQIQFARTVILSRTQNMTPEKIEECVALIKELNPDAIVVTTPWDDLTGEEILEAMENENGGIEAYIEEAMKEAAKHAHHHHHHDHDHHHDHEEDDHDEHEHEHHHHDDDDDDHDEHEHHHHDDDDDDHDEHEHHHHDDDDHDEHEHEHEHHHHHDHDDHDHDADEIFESIGEETSRVFNADALKELLDALKDGEEYGIILRAKGIVETDKGWMEFDLVPEELEIRECSPDVTGKYCVIGAELKEEAIEEAFRNAGV